MTAPAPIAVNKDERILMRAFWFLRHAGAWQRQDLARDGEGLRIDPREDAACSFCILGALRRAAWREGGRSDRWAIRRLNRTLEENPTLFGGHADVVSFNDDPRAQHFHLRLLFRMAIDAERADAIDTGATPQSEPYDDRYAPA